jgi:SWI/SNF-related matrix-associated actin-dependent regulator 1 of chromatin subfamily A
MTKLYPYQEEGVRQMHAFNGRCLLGDEMGLGKTIQALTFIKSLPDQRPVVVVCPAGLKINWEREAAKHINMRAEILDGRQPSGQQRLRYTPQLLIINYEILTAPWLKFIKSLKPQLVVLDECQYCTNPATKRTKAVRKLCAGVPRVVAMSGTPLLNRPIEMFPILNILKPTVFRDYHEYGQRYCQPRRGFMGIEYKGATRKKELNELLRKHVLIRRKKSVVLKDLPPKRRFVTIVPMRNDGERYAAAHRDFRAWISKNYRMAPGKFRLQSATRLQALLRLAAREKRQSIMKWIDNFLDTKPTEKLIVFAIHHDMIDKLAERYAGECVVVNGKVSKRDRQKAYDLFNNSRRIRLFLGNIQAAGVGWNGVISRTVAIVEIPWRPGDATQAEDRVWRIGQFRDCRIFYLVTKGTVEERLCSMLQTKQENLSGVLDGSSSVEDLNLLDLLTTELMENSDEQAETSS